MIAPPERAPRTRAPRGARGAFTRRRCAPRGRRDARAGPSPGGPAVLPGALPDSADPGGHTSVRAPTHPAHSRRSPSLGCPVGCQRPGLLGGVHAVAPTCLRPPRAGMGASRAASAPAASGAAGPLCASVHGRPVPTASAQQCCFLCALRTPRLPLLSMMPRTPPPPPRVSKTLGAQGLLGQKRGLV